MVNINKYRVGRGNFLIWKLNKKTVRVSKHFILIFCLSHNIGDLILNSFKKEDLLNVGLHSQYTDSDDFGGFGTLFQAWWQYIGNFGPDVIL